MLSIKRNALYGLLGFIIPAGLVFAVYPVLIRHLGVEPFGIYILGTSLSGALAFMDFGVSTATLKYLAEDMAAGRHRLAGEMIVTSVVFYFGVGVVSACLVWVVAPFLVYVLEIKAELQDQAVVVFRLCAVQFIAFCGITTAISIFKGLQRFDLSTVVLSSLSILTFGGALFGVLFAGLELIGVTAVSVVANVIVVCLAFVFGLHVCSASGIRITGGGFSMRAFRRMFAFGASMSINSVASVLLYRIQQYLVSALIGPSAVAAYVVASTVALKAHSIVNALAEVMFPLTSALHNRVRLREVYLRFLVGSAVLAFVCLAPLALFAEPILTFWVGSELAGQAAPILPIFAVGCVWLALSPAPYHVVNGIGRPEFNTAFYALNALMNVAWIGILWLDGISLEEFAWAFAFANFITCLLYQGFVELVVWRRNLLLVESSS